VTRELQRLQPNVDMAAGGRGSGALVALHHSESFYANFAALLRAAEAAGVFVLPPGPDKLAPRSLRRFDSLDPQASAAGFRLGSSPRFGGVSRPGPLRLVVADAAGRRKGITVENPTVAAVIKEARQKLNLRRGGSAWRLFAPGGAALDDAALAVLGEDAVVTIR